MLVGPSAVRRRQKLQVPVSFFRSLRVEKEIKKAITFSGNSTLVGTSIVDPSTPSLPPSDSPNV